VNTETNNQLMPVLFVSHGSPLLAVDAEKGEAYRQWADSLPKPEAILIFSAHWEGDSLAMGETRNHEELIYDFYGFPDPLYDLQYPAPGSEDLSKQVQSLLVEENIAVTHRGLDHGVWVPFIHMWPEADVPVLQMSMPSSLTNQDLVQLGEKLRPLREQGVLIVCSGMVTHNLRAWNPRYSGPTVDWAQRFDQWVKDTLNNQDLDGLLAWEQAPEALQNHPTAEHFRPMLIAAGASGLQDTSFPIEGFDFGILSNRCVQFG